MAVKTEYNFVRAGSPEELVLAIKRLKNLKGRKYHFFDFQQLSDGSHIAYYEMEQDPKILMKGVR